MDSYNCQAKTKIIWYKNKLSQIIESLKILINFDVWNTMKQKISLSVPGVL